MELLYTVVLNDYHACSKKSVKIRRVYRLERACKFQNNRIERLEWVYEVQNCLDRTRLYCQKWAYLTFWTRLERVYDVYKCCLGKQLTGVSKRFLLVFHLSNVSGLVK